MSKEILFNITDYWNFLNKKERKKMVDVVYRLCTVDSKGNSSEVITAEVEVMTNDLQRKKSVVCFEGEDMKFRLDVDDLEDLLDKIRAV